MNDVLDTARQLFGNSGVPPPEFLTRADGFDELEKKSAREFFANLSWQDLLSTLDSDQYCGLEEWTVLQDEPLKYYLRAYLEYCVGTLRKQEPDAEFLISFFHQLYQLTYMKKFKIFNSDEVANIDKMIGLAQSALGDNQKTWFEGDSAHLEDNIKMFQQQREK